MQPADPDGPATAKPRDRRLRRLATVAGVSFALAMAGTALSARFVSTQPELLLALSSRNRHLLLVKGTDISAVAFGLIPLFRILPVAAAYFLLARDYGEQGKAWYEKEAGDVPKALLFAERIFDRVGPASLLFFAGSQVAWILAGLRRLTLKSFMGWMFAGMVLRLTFFWFLGERFRPQIEDILGVIQRLQRPLTVLLIISVVFQTNRTMRRAEARAVRESDDDAV